MLRVECDVNYQLVSIHKYDKTHVAFLSVSCLLCSKGSYTIRYSSLVWNEQSRKPFLNHITCDSCSLGGSCDGRLRAQPLYWGFPDGDIIKFVRCTEGYCSMSPDHYQSCVNNRKGILCGECKDDHLLNIFSKKCTPSKDCKENIALPLILLAPLVLVIIVIFKSNIALI